MKILLIFLSLINLSQAGPPITWGSSGALLFQNGLTFPSTGTTNTFSFVTPNGLGSSVSLTLPDSDGAANECLITDGSGVLSFGSCLSGGLAFVNGGNSFAGTATIGTNDNNDFLWETNGTARGGVLSTGQTLIGTTSTGSLFSSNIKLGLFDTSDFLGPSSAKGLQISQFNLNFSADSDPDASITATANIISSIGNGHNIDTPLASWYSLIATDGDASRYAHFIGQSVNFNVGSSDVIERAVANDLYINGDTGVVLDASLSYNFAHSTTAVSGEAKITKGLEIDVDTSGSDVSNTTYGIHINGASASGTNPTAYAIYSQTNSESLFQGNINLPQLNATTGVAIGDTFLNADAGFRIKDKHIEATQTAAPACTNITNLGTGATCTVTGTDTAGIVSITTGTSAAPGDQFTVEFDTSFSYEPACVFSPLNPNSAAASGANINTGDGAFIFNVSSALTDSTEYRWSFICIGQFN